MGIDNRKGNSMQEIFRRLVWLIAGFMGVWLLAMAVSQSIFSRIDSDFIVRGTIAINNTDIDNQCGMAAKNSNAYVEYKLTVSGRVIYLCPLGWWPIQKRVVAKVLTDNFKRAIPPDYLMKIKPFYPDVAPVKEQQPAPLIPLPLT
jgi:hypothetical protein